MRRLASLLLVAIVLISLSARGVTQDLGDLYRSASASVVVIRAKGREVSRDGVMRFGEIGSGVLISTEGRVVTASHVVHGMEEITAEFLGHTPVRARVIGFQPAADLALLQLDSVPSDVPFATLADSDRTRVGDAVFVIGAPYGLTYSLSNGIISARWEPNTVTKDFPLAEFFQTTAAINTGNSGGPMFNMRGEVVGIVSHNISKSGGSEGLGFVVSTKTVTSLLLARRPFYLGVDGQIVSGRVAELLNLPQPAGYIVKTVVPGSLGERLGLTGGDGSATIDGQQLVLGGDIILTAMGVTILTIDDLIQASRVMRDLPSGSEVRMRVLRAGKVVELATASVGIEER